MYYHIGIRRRETHRTVEPYVLVFFFSGRVHGDIYNPGQNSLAKCILFPYFPSHAHTSTLYKILGTLFPPPISMLLFLIKSLHEKKSFAANNIDIGGEGNKMTSFAIYFVQNQLRNGKKFFTFFIDVNKEQFISM